MYNTRRHVCKEKSWRCEKKDICVACTIPFLWHKGNNNTLLMLDQCQFDVLFHSFDRVKRIFIDEIKVILSGTFSVKLFMINWFNLYKLLFSSVCFFFCTHRVTRILFTRRSIRRGLVRMNACMWERKHHLVAWLSNIYILRELQEWKAWQIQKDKFLKIQ